MHTLSPSPPLPPSPAQRFKDQIDTFRALHSGVFLGFGSRRKLPDDLLTLWRE
jgi:hypothetical protein